MMVSPEVYVNRFKDASYLELIRGRDELIQSIRKFEKAELAGDRSDPDWRYHPSPDVQYQMHLEYLSALCSFMQEKYNREYIWGDRTLKQDADASAGRKASARTADVKKAEQNFNATLELMNDILRPGSNQ